jgi:molecular chaperone DnaJ
VQFTLRFQQPCQECAGVGVVSDEKCKICGGFGKIPQKPRSLRVHVPPGIRTGSVLRIQGAGRYGSGFDGVGDLLLRVVVRPCW